MADYWKTIIREGRDAFRTYVSDPALFERLDTLDENSRILDAGCGEGYVSRRLTKQGHEVIGIDLSEPLIEHARELATTETYQVCDVLTLPFDEQTFDVVVANFLLMEFEHPELAIQRLAKVLRHGGRFIFQILNPRMNTSLSGVMKGEEDRYHETQRLEERFVVDGTVSPRAAVYFHHPFERYEQALAEHGFRRIYRAIPEPIAETPTDHAMIKTLKQPWFVLMDYEKVQS